ncbi:MAG: peptidase M28, partial [Bacteroidota bacterium]
MKFLPFVFLLLCSGQLISQLAIKEDLASQVAETITAEDLNKHLSVLASDDYEGRETGTEGNRKAAAYIADQFKAFGIKPCVEDSYYQGVAFSKVKFSENTMTINGNKYKHLWEYLTYHSYNTDLELNEDEVLFLGYGIDDPAYSDYKGKSVEGKTILIYGKEPVDEDGNSLITGTSDFSDWTNNLEKKLLLAKAKGVKSVFIIQDNLKELLDKSRRFFMNTRLELGEPADAEKF